MEGEKWRIELYKILGLLDIQVGMIEAWIEGKQVLAPRRAGVTTSKQAKKLVEFIQQELDKAREEGFEQGYKEAKFDCEMGKEFSKVSFKEVVSSVLSKLKTKEDGK